MSNEPIIIIRLDGNGRVYWPGETLSGEYRIGAFDAHQIKAVEISVLWYTEGKGDEDMAIHQFWRRPVDDTHTIEPGRPERFSTILPNSPLTYEGHIIKLHWCVRLRVFPQRGKEVVGEKAFRLGDVPMLRS
jgi:hypothetical protein